MVIAILCIIRDYSVSNWKSDRGIAKKTTAYFAVSRWLSASGQHRNVDPTFKEPRGDQDTDGVDKQWAHQIDKFFSPHERVKLPHSFGDYLVTAIDEEFRKLCLAKLDRKRRTIIAGRPATWIDLTSVR